MIRKIKFKLHKEDKEQIVVKIDNDGTISITGLPPVITDDDNSINLPLAIWKMYKNYRSGDKVIRSGSGLCGVYPYKRNRPRLKNYIETDTMHSTTVEEVAQNIFRFYPALFTEKEQIRIVHLLRYHDLGEKIDNPDDGSTPHDKKFKRELKRFIRKISSLQPAVQEMLIRDFIMFENADFVLWDKKSRELMQFAKLCDKADAPLGAFLYEKQGRKGSLMYKKKHFGGITDQDEAYAQEIGDYSQAGIWTAHMIDHYQGYEYLDLFVEIIAAACKDVRGSVFPWLRSFLERRQLFNEQVINRICS